MTGNSEPQTFLTGANATFIEQLYGHFLDDPGSVDDSWRDFFADQGDDVEAVLKQVRGVSWKRPDWPLAPEDDGLNGAGTEDRAAPAAKAALADGLDSEATRDSIRALMFIRAYRVRGHLLADLDPLKLHERAEHPELDPANSGFGEADMDRPIFINNVLGLKQATMREILDILKRTYCSTYGVEFMHIVEPEEKRWLQKRIEGRDKEAKFPPEVKLDILRKLTATEGFEQTLHRKFPGTKRFGLDGGEALIPSLEAIIRRGAELGAREFVIGMPHRGRLNIMANVMEKPAASIFGEFLGAAAHPDHVQNTGDVKYHLGVSSDRDLASGEVHLSLSANPSHLEAVDPVVLGKVRAKQLQHGDTDRIKVVPILMHGDCSFYGQGLVAECFALSGAKGHRTGGTIHVIVNNQIGFTTDPRTTRVSPYPSDVAKMVQAPIFHVNGDDPEAVVHVSRIATEFRQKFRRDVVIDIFCYRRFGHNEGDDPTFTQPLMYRKIAEHPTVRRLYVNKLVAEGSVTKEVCDQLAHDVRAGLDQAFEDGGKYKPDKADWLEGAWAGLGAADSGARRGDTAVEMKTLKHVGKALVTVPDGFNIHKTLVRQLKAKAEAFKSGENIDWATGEALAFGTLVAEGFRVRLSGQDCGRGTFSQRHSVWVDQETEARHVPLNHIPPLKGKGAPLANYEVLDSVLSEMAVLGFEYGYSMAEPDSLVIWEAQFGDFANGAQVIIDQFIVPGEAKWLRMSGLVVLLPHGFEGQGPEHSSARLERYLQLCGDDNIQVVNCTSPANYFHVLRRQLQRKFRKPLFIMSPKSLLRHKRAVSRLAEMGPGTTFHRLLWDDAEVEADSKVNLRPDRKMQRVVMCSGKVYYDLYEERERRGTDGVYLLRLEQLYPFPARALTKELGRFPQAEMVWCQEEPKNMGAWHFVEGRLESLLRRLGASHQRPIYAGRRTSAAPATGVHSRHLAEQAALVDMALTL